uniref:Acylamino-acid-releasing enzyme n=1 Tax=Rhizophora mucronata TaxID=61149 RepID=A0A2P2LK41_RHIMU
MIYSCEHIIDILCILAKKIIVQTFKCFRKYSKRILIVLFKNKSAKQ